MTVSQHDAFLRWGVVSTSPNPRTGGPPLVDCQRLPIQYIRSYPPHCKPFLHPQPDEAPCRGDWDPVIMALKTLRERNQFSQHGLHSTYCVLKEAKSARCFVTVMDRYEYTSTGTRIARQVSQCQCSYLISSSFMYIFKYEIKEMITTYCQHYYTALANR